MPEFSFQSSVLEKDEIRLLHLRGGDAQDELVGNIEVVKVTATEKKPYDTLSYTWGDEEPSEHIKIIHSNQQYYIRIRPNLHQALQHLRFHRTDRYLWVDAICINQADEREKSSQVRMISEIFTHSSSVRVWVGPEKDDSRRAIKFIKSRLVHEDSHQLFEHADYRHEWLALSKLMRRPWFSRRWIIQEIAMAKSATLHCGTDSLSWETFAEAVMLFIWGQTTVYDTLRPYPECDPGLIRDIRESPAARLIQAHDNIFRKSQDGQLLEKLMSLEDLLCRFSASEALDPRDSIYALLSIARDATAGFPVQTGTTREATPEHPPDPSTTSYFLASPVTTDGNHLPWYAEEEANGEAASSFQPILDRKRPVSNTDSIHGLDPSTARQTKRIQTDLPASNGVAAGIMVADESRPIDTPAIRISDAGNTEATQVSPTAANGSEAFPKLGEHIPATPPSGLTVLSPVQVAQEETLTPSMALGGRPRNLSDSSLQNQNHSNSYSSNNSSNNNNTDQHGDDQNMTWLQVPQRGRGNSSASIISNQTETYYIHVENMRRKQAKEHAIPVNYGSPVSEVCKEVMRYSFSKTQSLNMICRPWAPRVNPVPAEAGSKGGTSSFPSWIQPVTKGAFSRTHHNGTYTRINADPLVGSNPTPGGQCFYNATPNVLARWKIDKDGENILTVYGFELDEILHKAPPAYAGIIPVRWNELAEWEDTTISPPPDAFWRTLVGNRDNKGQQAPKLWRRACRIAFGMKSRDGPLEAQKVLEEASPPSFVKEYLEKVVQTTCSRRLSIGKNKYWALVPEKAKKGDKLCVINGCSVPVVLRCTSTTTTTTTTHSTTSTTSNGVNGVNGSTNPAKCQREECQAAGQCKCKKEEQKKDDKIYEMIGECYIHGMMDGEALLYQDKNDITPCMFKIR